jgi:hypothetical protein
MEGYDNMDNNTNNNISGIPNVSDIKFDDTPAESFDNLYGNGANSADNRPMASVEAVQGPTMVPNPDMNFNPGIGMNAQPNPAPVGPASVQPVVNPAPVEPAINPAPVEPVVNPAPVQPAVNPTPVAPTPVQSAVNPTPVQPAVNLAPVGPAVNPAPVQPAVNPAPVGPVPVQQPAAASVEEDLSNMVIDDDKMQSIEEQLSKTSQYNPADFQQEQITIPTDNEYEKNKSATAFLVVLLIIALGFVALLPQLTKMIG